MDMSINKKKEILELFRKYLRPLDEEFKKNKLINTTLGKDFYRGGGGILERILDVDKEREILEESIYIWYWNTFHQVLWDKGDKSVDEVITAITWDNRWINWKNKPLKNILKESDTNKIKNSLEPILNWKLGDYLEYAKESMLLIIKDEIEGTNESKRKIGELLGIKQGTQRPIKEGSFGGTTPQIDNELEDKIYELEMEKSRMEKKSRWNPFKNRNSGEIKNREVELKKLNEKAQRDIEKTLDMNTDDLMFGGGSEERIKIELRGLVKQIRNNIKDLKNKKDAEDFLKGLEKLENYYKLKSGIPFFKDINNRLRFNAEEVMYCRHVLNLLNKSVEEYLIHQISGESEETFSLSKGESKLKLLKKQKKDWSEKELNVEELGNALKMGISKEVYRDRMINLVDQEIKKEQDRIEKKSNKEPMKDKLSRIYKGKPSESPPLPPESCSCPECNNEKVPMNLHNAVFREGNWHHKSCWDKVLDERNAETSKTSTVKRLRKGAGKIKITGIPKNLWIPMLQFGAFLLGIYLLLFTPYWIFGLPLVIAGILLLLGVQSEREGLRELFHWFLTDPRGNKWGMVLVVGIGSLIIYSKLGPIVAAIPLIVIFTYFAFGKKLVSGDDESHFVEYVLGLSGATIVLYYFFGYYIAAIPLLLVIVARIFGKTALGEHFTEFIMTGTGIVLFIGGTQYAASYLYVTFSWSLLAGLGVFNTFVLVILWSMEEGGKDNGLVKAQIDAAEEAAKYYEGLNEKRSTYQDKNLEEWKKAAEEAARAEKEAAEAKKKVAEAEEDDAKE